MIPELVKQLRWTDLVDILVLWFALYRSILLVRGTRAFQSLLGLLVALVIYIVAGRLELYAVHWMLEKFFVYIVLAVIILFQSDIKRALAGAGGRLFPSLAGPSDQNALEEVVRASFIMATRRIGALIAFQREASLGDYAEGGNRLDARVSSELLLAIFHPTSP
jgi:diadenylate cyclase